MAHNGSNNINTLYHIPLSHSDSKSGIKKKKKKVIERSLKRSDLTYCPRQERERLERTRHGVDVYGARWSARSSSGKGQKAAATSRGQRDDGWVEKWEVRSENLRFSVEWLLKLVDLGYITKSMVLVSPFVKICDFLFFFLFFFFCTAGVSDLSELCQRQFKEWERSAIYPRDPVSYQPGKVQCIFISLLVFLFIFWQWKFWKICVRMEFSHDSLDLSIIY